MSVPAVVSRLATIEVEGKGSNWLVGSLNVPERLQSMPVCGLEQGILVEVGWQPFKFVSN